VGSEFPVGVKFHPNGSAQLLPWDGEHADAPDSLRAQGGAVLLWLESFLNPRVLTGPRRFCTWVVA